MWPAIASRLTHAYKRYFSVKHAAVAEEVARASESAAKAVAAAKINVQETDRLAHDMSRLDTMLRNGGQ